MEFNEKVRLVADGLKPDGKFNDFEIMQLCRQLREAKSGLRIAEAKLKEYEQATKLSGEVNAKLAGELLELKEKVEAMESQNPFAWANNQGETTINEIQVEYWRRGGYKIIPLYAGPVPDDKPAVIKGSNRFGLDVGYLSEKLSFFIRDIENHKPDEAARVLARLAKVSDESVLREPEFSDNPAVAVPGVHNRELLRAIVDKAWGEATESQNVPSTKWADQIIDSVIATAPSHSQQSTEFSMVSNKVIRFLLGESELDGLWFGEKFNGMEKVNSFWWRKHLPKLKNDDFTSQETKGA